MSSVNKVILVGNLGQEPEIRALKSGSNVASFSLATSERYKDKSGQPQEKTEWHKIVCLREKLVEVIEKYVHKGDKLYLEGKLTTRKWQDNNGIDRYTTEIILDSLTMLGGKSDSSPAQQHGQKKQYKQSQPVAVSEPDGFDDIDDDIPF
jgi:single-strand DNA-binding protein